MLLPYAHGQHMNVLKHFVYVYCECRKQFEEAVSLNHDIMTSFWLHKWPKTPKYDPSSVGIPVWGYCHMPMNSIWMCSKTLYMSNVDVGRSLRWLPDSTTTLCHHFDSTSDLEPQNMSQCGGITVWCYCHMPMDSIWMCSNTLHMSNVGARSSLSWLSASTMM